MVFNLLSLAVTFQKGRCEIMEWKRGDEKNARGLDKEVNICTNNNFMKKFS